MQTNKKIIPFNYFGGKFNHLDFVLSLLPESYSFVELFGGSGIITWNKKPSKIETFNDVNNSVINFFEVLRDNGDELIKKIYLTPYAREEYFNCYHNINVGDAVERARNFFVVVNMSFNGTMSRQTGWKMSTNNTRASISEAVSRWLSKLPNLIAVIERMKTVQILNMDYRRVIKKFDSPRTLFYAEPPYLHEVRCNKNEYEHEMSINDHVELLTIVKSIQGRIAISGYENELYNDHLTQFKKFTARKKGTGLFHSSSQEVVWTNYDPFEYGLFSQSRP
jgi:DNA adenine methylase